MTTTEEQVYDGRIAAVCEPGCAVGTCGSRVPGMACGGCCGCLGGCEYGYGEWVDEVKASC